MGSKTEDFKYSAKGLWLCVSRTYPTTAMAAFEYLVCVFGAKTRSVSFKLCTVAASEGNEVSK